MDGNRSCRDDGYNGSELELADDKASALSNLTPSNASDDRKSESAQSAVSIHGVDHKGFDLKLDGMDL